MSQDRIIPNVTVTNDGLNSIAPGLTSVCDAALQLIYEAVKDNGRLMAEVCRAQQVRDITGARQLSTRGVLVVIDNDRNLQQVRQAANHDVHLADVHIHTLRTVMYALCWTHS